MGVRPGSLWAQSPGALWQAALGRYGQCPGVIWTSRPGTYGQKPRCLWAKAPALMGRSPGTYGLKVRLLYGQRARRIMGTRPGALWAKRPAELRAVALLTYRIGPLPVAGNPRVNTISLCTPWAASRGIRIYWVLGPLAGALLRQKATVIYELTRQAWSARRCLMGKRPGGYAITSCSTCGANGQKTLLFV